MGPKYALSSKAESESVMNCLKNGGFFPLLVLVSLAGCNQELAQAQRLGFATVAEMKEIKAKGFDSKKSFEAHLIAAVEADKLRARTQKAQEQRRLAEQVAIVRSKEIANLVSQCAANHLANIALSDGIGLANRSEELSRFTDAWGDLALAAGRRAGIDEMAIKEMNRENFQKITADLPTFSRENKVRNLQCTNLIKENSDLREVFAASVGGERIELAPIQLASSEVSYQGVDIIINSMHQLSHTYCSFALDLKNNTPYNITGWGLKGVGREADKSITGTHQMLVSRVKPSGTTSESLAIPGDCDEIRFLRVEIMTNLVEIDGVNVRDTSVLDEITSGKLFSRIRSVSPEQ